MEYLIQVNSWKAPGIPFSAESCSILKYPWLPLSSRSPQVLSWLARNMSLGDSVTVERFIINFLAVTDNKDPSWISN